MKKIFQEKNEYILRLDKGEELILALKEFSKKENIKSAFFFGLGAAMEAEISFYDLNKREYISKRIKEILEIASLIGNVAFKEKEIVVHAHIILTDRKMRSFGGHLNSLIVGGTCEIYLKKFRGKINREFSEEIGLNLLK